MHRKFDHQAIEKKWQEKWRESGIYNTGERDASKEKEYVLVEWPYPSGNLHIGHWFAFAVVDIYVRAKRMLGKQVLFPMGFDAFGLPAENAAIKRNLDPKKWTDENIAYMRGQLESMGNAFSWDKTTSSTDPEYYKWTQWMFAEFFKKGIAYRGTGTVNWCPGCNTVIANEQVLADGTCERSGDVIEKREMPQWLLRITDYADRLIDDLEGLDWPEHIKESQRNWIGKSSGANISFPLLFTYEPEANDNRGPNGEKAAISVFTTRPDMLYGATFLVLAPEHLWVTLAIDEQHDVLENKEEVQVYVAAAAQKSQIERANAEREKTGVELKGVKAINPATGEEVPLFVADYVLADYGTGAIMAVPAHDERDNEFAKKFNVPIRQVVRKVFGEPLPDPVHRVAAGAIVHDPKTEKYLIQYSHEFKKHSPIFGGVEEGESYAEAAVRETLEETGYRTKFLRYVGEEVESHFYHPGKKINRALVSRVALLELADETQSAIPKEELAKQEPVWVTAEELPKLLTDERDAYDVAMLFKEQLYTGAGTLCNSGEFDGMNSEEAKEAITKKVGGKITSTYRLRDWSIGRQRYWGVPVPIVYDREGKAHPIPKEHLPWLLPTDVDFKPTGEPPLAKSKELKERTEKIFGPGWTPDVETMDTFVDSSWYFLRYLDNKNDDSLSSLETQKQWMPIDIYFGGAEHTTMHLLYSRFWQKALFDLGLVTESEPYKKRINRGLVLGPDGNKMSKSKGNVIDPDEQVTRLGADTVKMYLAFMGPYGETTNYPWDMGGIAGLRRFLERVNGLSGHIKPEDSDSVQKLLHKTIKKVRADIAEYKFNTAISAMMIFINVAEKEGLSEASYTTFLKLLAPFAPHLTEELWYEAGETDSIHLQSFPEYDETLVKDDLVTIGVQINGKARGSITVAPDASKEEVVAAVKASPELKERLAGGITKVIYVPGRILNLLVQ